MNITLKVEGLDKLDKALGNLSQDLQGKALYQALNYAGTPMLKEAKQRASLAQEPHSMEYKGSTVIVLPGLLKSAIRRRRLKKRELARYRYSAAISIYIGKGTSQKVYPRYWHFIEYGTSQMRAVPFLRPAFDHNKHEAVTRFKHKLAQNIAKYR